MKNKKMIYVLLPLVVFIWGLIIYRIFAVAGPIGTNLNAVPITSITEDNKSVSDTFSLLAEYPDPFLGKLVSLDQHTIYSGTIKKEKAKKVPVLQSQWPSISYSGMIKNQQSNRQLVMVTINGSSNVMKIGDAAMGIALLKIYRDSMEIGMGKERRIVKRN